MNLASKEVKIICNVLSTIYCYNEEWNKQKINVRKKFTRQKNKLFEKIWNRNVFKYIYYLCQYVIKSIISNDSVFDRRIKGSELVKL